MTNEALLKMPLHIEVISPTHVGTEERLNNKSFVSLNQKVYVVNERKLLAIVSRTPRLQVEFEKFCLEPIPLERFLQRNGLKAEDVAEYGLEKMGTQMSGTIFPFIKVTTDQPRPYLPGSSLKGALRSALLRSHLLANQKARSAGEGKVKEKFKANKPKAADDALEQWYFGEDQHHEWLRLLQITDTKPVGLSHLGVADVRVFSSTKDHRLKQKEGNKPGQPFVLSPEVLIPHKTLRATLVLNQYLTQEPAERELAFKKRWSTITNFVTACNRVAEDQIAQEIDFYKYHHHSDLVEWYEKLDERRKGLRADYSECLIRLGWGTGYDNKTVSDVFDDETFKAIRNTYDLPVGRPGRKGAPLPKFLSPKSRKLAIVKNEQGDEEFQPLGWLLLRA